MYFILLVSAHLAIANNIVRSTANKLAEIGTKVFNKPQSCNYAYLHSRNAFLVVLLIITFESKIFYKVKPHESEIVFFFSLMLT